MRRWSEVAERVAATTRTSEKTTQLAEYLSGLTLQELPIAVVFLTGRPFAEADQRAAGLGWSAIATTVTELARVPRAALGEAYDRFSDLGMAVQDILERAGHAPDPATWPTLVEVAAAYAAIEVASGPAAKSGILRRLLDQSDPLTAKYVVKVLSGELRIGLREGLVEAAIAKAFDRPLDEVKWAGMLIGDIGRTAEMARDGLLGEASLALFHPIKFMLASPAEDADEIVRRLGVPIWVEDKYSNLDMQIRVTDQKVADALGAAGVPLRDGVISTTGRTALDLQNHKLTYMIDGQSQLVSSAQMGPLAMNRPRYWQVEGADLILTTKDDNGQPLAVSRWKK